MKQVGRQIPLSTVRALRMAWTSLRVRRGRSVLTLITIVMAIMFLTNVWATRRFEPAIRGAALAAQGVAPAPDPTGEGRTVWLLSLSLLVCLVGIANAMLMSVMERFREIGTMKCLGALDSFILKLFFLESMLLGAAGSIAGAVIGMMLTLSMLVKDYGGAAWREVPAASCWQIGAASVAIGLMITAAAALYPAWKAARMEPIAAMRVEV